MAQIARKLPSEAKPRMVNCDLGHSFFMAKGRIRFFCGSGEKTRLCRTRSRVGSKGLEVVGRAPHPYSILLPNGIKE